MLILSRTIGQRIFVGAWMVVTLDEIRPEYIVVSVDNQVRNIHKQFRVHVQQQAGVYIDHEVALFNAPSPSQHAARLGFSAPKSISIMREELRVCDERRAQKTGAA